MRPESKWNDAAKIGVDIGFDQERRQEIGLLNLTSFNKCEASFPSP